MKLFFVGGLLCSYSDCFNDNNLETFFLKPKMITNPKILYTFSTSGGSINLHVNSNHVGLVFDSRYGFDSNFFLSKMEYVRDFKNFIYGESEKLGLKRLGVFGSDYLFSIPTISLENFLFDAYFLELENNNFENVSLIMEVIEEFYEVNLPDFSRDFIDASVTENQLFDLVSRNVFT